ncbi:major facilitator superfamily domain-containing protein [Aspergillus parasiticus]|uniref:Major facilitator superfamily domain-containing protein n=1 Tax=Aspergillus parasiticus TaxID=5067 RepID=A0A5N6E502_ASPPA|nr:major facilitator superfamily domain-containing protein [Aspergillus parasiticus]
MSSKVETSSLSEHVEYCPETSDAKTQLPHNDNSYNAEFVKRVKWKVDKRLCVVIAVMYTICQIDRQNLPNAVIAGMGKEIDLSGNHYSTIVVTFFPFYTLFQPPMTVIARKIGPRTFLGGTTVAWGLVMVGFGLVHDWRALVGLRAVLGLLEAGFFSTCVFLIGTWYVRHEVAKRIAFFYLFGNALGGFGGILAFGAGHAGWRWIFIMEGAITCAIGIIGSFWIVDFPEDARRTKWFLTNEEIDLMIDRVQKDREDAHLSPFNLKEYIKNAADWRGWLFALNFALTSAVIYAVAYFLPIVLRDGLKFSVAQAQTLNAPCYVFGGILGFTESWLSDRYRNRGSVIIFNSLLEIIGICVLGFATNSSVRYFGAFILVGGANANLPACLTYQSNNITGQWRRAFASALIVGSGGVGGVIGSLVFREQDSPSYRPGLYTCLVAAGVTIVSVCITSVYMARMNVQQKRGGIIIEGTEGFRYTL